MSHDTAHAPYTAQPAGDGSYLAPLAAPISAPTSPGGEPPRRRSPWLRILLSAAGLVVGIVVAVLALAGPGSVPASTVGEQLGAQFGVAVSCTDDLPAQVGATTTCSATDSDGVHPILVRATSVDGSTVHFEGTVQ